MDGAPAKTRVVWQWLSSSSSFSANATKAASFKPISKEAVEPSPPGQTRLVAPQRLFSISLANPKEKVRMNLRSITPCSPRIPLHRNPGSNRLLTPLPPPLTPHFRNNNNLRYQRNDFRRDRLVTSCIVDSLDDEEPGSGLVHSSFDEEQAELRSSDWTESSIWHQMKEIVLFAGPATGLWICGPLMSLIDTAVIGQGSSVELAALGPGTVFCDYTSYIFMFLSIATSNMVATSLATQDKNQVQHRISVLLFVGLTCGFIMFFFTRFFGSSALAAFTGPKNVHLLPAANTYVQIRGLAWPSVLIGWVAQSASLGMKDSWGPLKALVVASVVNGVGDIVLCRVMSYGIAGAAWATMASQVIASYMMLAALNNKGYSAFSVSIPTLDELMRIVGLAAPVFIVMMSKVAFFTLLIYFATSMGTVTAAAHQVMLQSFYMCTVWGEPLSQTAQSFMPELLYGVNRSLDRARMLLKSLVVIGVIVGIVLGCVATIIPSCFPYIFTPDQHVIREMHKVLIPFFLALSVTPPTLSLEGTLLAGQDLKFISTSMSGCFTFGALLLQLVSGKGFGLTGCWYTLAGFQWARFLLALWRLTSPNSIIYVEDPSRLKVEKLKAA